MTSPEKPERSEAVDVLRGLAITMVLLSHLLLCATLQLEERGTQKNLMWRLFLSLGAVSYSLYLVHEPVFVISKRLTVGFLPDPLILMLRPTAALVTAWLFYMFVERYWMARSQKVKLS